VMDEEVLSLLLPMLEMEGDIRFAFPSLAGGKALSFPFPAGTR